MRPFIFSKMASNHWHSTLNLLCYVLHAHLFTSQRASQAAVLTRMHTTVQRFGTACALVIYSAVRKLSHDDPHRLFSVLANLCGH